MESVRGNNVGAKRSQKRYDISDYDFPIPDFMTNSEIKEMYKSLTFHMKMKYGVYDEETIHRTIIRGLHKADKYDPTKASKLVWFQSILYFYWIQENSSKYNPGVNDLSLSTSLSKDDPDFLVIDTIDGGDHSWKEYAEESEADKIEGVAGIIHDFIISGDYPYLQKRCMGMSYKDILKEERGKNSTTSNAVISSRIHNERERLKREISGIREVDEVLSQRVPVWMWTFDKYGKRKEVNSTCTCRSCSKEFQRLPGGGSKLYCSEGCRTFWIAEYQKIKKMTLAGKKMEPKTCRHCGRNFMKTENNRSRNWCSNSCKRLWNLDYQKEVYRKKTGRI